MVYVNEPGFEAVSLKFIIPGRPRHKATKVRFAKLVASVNRELSYNNGDGWKEIESVYRLEFKARELVVLYAIVYHRSKHIPVKELRKHFEALGFT